MRYLFFVIIFSSLFINCRKNDPGLGGQETPIDTLPSPVDTAIIELGKGTVLKNGITWEAPFNAWYHIHTHERFQLRAKIIYSNLRSESLSLHDIPCKIGTYPIELYSIYNFNNSIPESVFIMMQDYDQPIGDFLIDTTRADHFIEVIKYDSTAHTVEGRFQMFLKKEPSNISWPGVPGSIFLTEGKFHLKIQEP